jgi:sec-independent protein translocase protein TatC
MSRHQEPAPPPDFDEREQSFISHLRELRDRLIRCVLCLLIVILVLMPIANSLYEWVAAPMIAQMSEVGAQMIATEVASPFLAPFKFACFMAVMISVPYLFYQLWAFVSPGLYRHERHLALPLLASTVGLFYLGAAFAYFAVFPVIFGFLTTAAHEGVTVMTDISKYLDFVIVMFFAFGLAFEIPVATFMLVKTGVATRQDLVAKRPYVVVGVFVLAAILTPPDPVSQTLMAVPMCALWEIGLLFCKWFIEEEDEEDEEDEIQAAALAALPASESSAEKA